MGQETKIQWTEATWNPLRGCSRVSEGCRNCYAEHVARRFAGPGEPYEGLVRLDASGRPKAQWNGTIRKVPEHLDDPLRWRKPRKVFVNSMSDIFHESVDFGFIAAVYGVMASAPMHTFQVLTKRPERAREFFAWLSANGKGAEQLMHVVVAAQHALNEAASKADTKPLKVVRGLRWPLDNVWLGVSIEDQATAEERVPQLLAMKGDVAKRWVSLEPQLGEVHLEALEAGSAVLNALTGNTIARDSDGTRSVVAHGPALDWIVVGGESGHGARPFDIAWARTTLAEASTFDVPVFVKQLGARPVAQHPAGPPALPSAWRARSCPKTACE